MPTRKTTKKNAAKTRAKATRKAAAKRSAPAKRSAAKAARPKTRAKANNRTLQLSTVAPSLTVNDIAQSLTWYCDVLGFVVKQRWEHEGVVRGGELESGGVTIYVGQDDWKKGRDRVKGEGIRIYWYTNQNIDALAAAIKSRGGVLASEPKDEYGSRSFSLEDPTGYKITVSSEQ